MAKAMKDLPFPDLPEGASKSATVEFTLDDDYLLDDTAFSDKEDAMAQKGDVVTLTTYENYGMVKHPVHGAFRY
jgi:hypothetical protein